MGQCLFCENEAGIDKRKRIRKCCSNSCVTKLSARNRSMKEKKCIACSLIYLPKFTSKQLFCTKSCKAKFMWKNGRCKVPSEISLKNLIPFKNEGKSQLHGNNRYKRIGKKGIKEHRLIVEQHLGRKLDRSEHIHHINGNPRDNRIENLKIVSASEHGKIHSRK